MITVLAPWIWVKIFYVIKHEGVPRTVHAQLCQMQRQCISDTSCIYSVASFVRPTVEGLPAANRSQSTPFPAKAHALPLRPGATTFFLHVRRLGVTKLTPSFRCTFINTILDRWDRAMVRNLSSSVDGDIIGYCKQITSIRRIHNWISLASLPLFLTSIECTPFCQNLAA